MTATGLLNAFAGWSAEQKPLVLASVYETFGSTYSKAGAQMLITNDGDFQGMLSGGCLEGDLAERARAVLESGQPQSVTYDLGVNDEELWGLGVGCDGLMKIFLQPLYPDAEYEPFASMVRAFDGERLEIAATVIESEIVDLPAGATMVTANGQPAFSSIAADRVASFADLMSTMFTERRSVAHRTQTDSGSATVLFSLLQPPPAILVLGAGLDAEPVVRFACELGWRVTVQDHRPAYIESGDFSGAEHVLCLPVKDVSAAIEFDRFAAVIVMSHHLASDRQYLGQLADSRIPYIGLLGPIDRRRRLMQELAALGGRLEGRVHGPAGIDIGGRGPASIALSIIAEMHQALMHPASLA